MRVRKQQKLEKMENYRHLGTLTYTKGARKKVKRIGRGPGSGHGGTSTRGHKGQKSRSGASVNVGFEGGQMPIHRRLPKFGFSNRFRKEYQIINLNEIQICIDKNTIGTDINTEALLSSGLINNNRIPVKILGNGEIKSSINISADKFSDSAKSKIESAGGKVTINE